jgi:hypothetical protein
LRDGNGVARNMTHMMMMMREAYQVSSSYRTESIDFIHHHQAHMLVWGRRKHHALEAHRHCNLKLLEQQLLLLMISRPHLLLLLLLLLLAELAKKQEALLPLSQQQKLKAAHLSFAHSSCPSEKLLRTTGDINLEHPSARSERLLQRHNRMRRKKASRVSRSSKNSAIPSLNPLLLLLLQSTRKRNSNIVKKKTKQKKRKKKRKERPSEEEQEE